MGYTHLLAIIFLLLTATIMPVFAASENFTITFPQGNGTTTYITFQQEQDKATENIIQLFVVAAVVIGAAGIILRKSKSR